MDLLWERIRRLGRWRRRDCRLCISCGEWDMFRGIHKVGIHMHISLDL